MKKTGRYKKIMGRCPVCKEVLRVDRTWVNIENWESEDAKARKLLDAHLSDNPVCTFTLVDYKMPKF